MKIRELIEKVNSKAPIKIGVIIFVFVVLCIVFGNSFLFGHGFHIEYSISRYIGLELWSAIFFFLNSLFLVNLLLIFYKKIKTTFKMPKLWQICFIIMIITFIGLSCCPVGFFDETWGDFGVVSHLHRFFSFSMFLISILVSIINFFKFQGRKSKIITLSFAIYGTLFAISYAVNNSFVLNGFLFFETLFLLWFLTSLLVISSENLPKVESKTN